MDTISLETAVFDTAVFADTETNGDTLAETRTDAETDETDADAGAPPFCDVTDANLIACYRFEQAEHAVQPWDDSAYGHHGTSSKVSFVSGVSGRALQPAPDSLVNVPYAATLGVTSAITIEAWVKAKTLPATGRAGIVDDNGRYGLFIAPGGILRAMSPAVLESPPILTTGSWIHVAYTYDGATQVLYVAGLVSISRALIGGTYGASDRAGLAIGMNSPSGDIFDGAIDSVRIFRIARTAKQICEAAGKSSC